jgi:tripartite-type tricarboxylate transporter receptor subunit TctC
MTTNSGPMTPLFAAAQQRLWPRARRQPARRWASAPGLALGLLLTALQALAPAQAQDYPSRPVRIIVPFAPGGSADVFGRQIAQRLQEALGQNFIIDNRPGGGSVIGTDAVAKAAPDGYTLLLMSNTHTVNESLIPSKSFVLMRDFVPIAPISFSDLVLVTKPTLEARTLPDLIKRAKERPGAMSYASSGPGTPYHMAGELFKAMAGISVVHIPYRGSAGARSDVIGGQLEMMFDAIPTMAEQVKAGKVRALATTGRTRSAVMPEVPTMAEAGVPGYEATLWLGLMAPKGTPSAVVAKLNAELTRITTNADVRRAWGTQGSTPMTMNPEEFTRYMNDDITKWARIVKISGAKPE